MADVVVTNNEQKAINRLKQLAKKWPDSLSLFSWSGSLVVMKNGIDGRRCVISEISGIENDGGDPSGEEVNQFADVENE